MVVLTTIACSREAMVGDLQYNDEINSTRWKGAPKIYRFRASRVCDVDFIAGFAGAADYLIQHVDYFGNPEVFSPPEEHEGRGLVLTAKGDIFMFSNCLKWLKVRQPFAAIGSGANIALGAMASGKTPKEAVKIASKIDLYTGLGFVELNRLID